MNLKKSALMLSFAAAMALLNTSVFAIDMSHSEIIKTTGKVSVKKTNSPEFKKLNTNLKLSGSLKNLDAGDKVRTMANSTADLVLKDTCILVVQEQSIFEVPQVLNNKDLVSFKAQQGSILFKVAKGSNFQVQTADVICGVKGTMFSVTIVDGLNTMLETPGLQLGYAFKGGTAVNVYEGEVEVIHKSSKEKKTLKAGEGIAAVNTLTNTADIALDVVRFDPESKAREIYGTSLDKLKKATFLKDLEGIDALDSYNSKLRYDNNLVKKFNKLDNPIVQKYSSKIYEANNYNNEVKEWNSIAGKIKGQKYHADFSRYSKLDSERSFGSSFSEVYMGNNTVAACKAGNGSSSLKAEPGLSGLVVTEGNGSVKMRIYNDNLGTTGEVMANIYEKGNDIYTVIRNNDGKLSWREPGSLEIQKVPAGDVAYVFNKNTCKGRWMQASAANLGNELIDYSFAVEQTMQNEKHQLEKKNKEDRKEALKKGANKVGNLLKKKGKFF